MNKAAIALAIAAAVSLTPARAQAQSGNAVFLLPTVLPPVAVSVVLDAALMAMLAERGTAGRGLAITSLVFGIVGFAASMVAYVLNTVPPTEVYDALCFTGMAASVGTVAVGTYALTRPPPDDGDVIKQLKVVPTAFPSVSGVGLGGGVSFRWY